MSIKRYIELDSTYRNRFTYPNPGEFEIPVSQSGMRNKEHAFDPISSAQPIKTWTPDDFSGSVGVVIDNSSSTNQRLLIQSPVDTLNKEFNYYNGQPITANVAGDDTFITSWQYSNTISGMDNFWITIDPPIENTTGNVDFIGSTSIVDGLFYVPGNLNIDFSYIGYILWNNNHNNGEVITGYDNNTHLLSVDNIPVGWVLTDSYSIREKTPSVIGEVVSVTSNSVTSSSSISTSYTYDFIRFPKINKSFKIIKIEDDVIVFNGSLSGIVATDKFEILSFTSDNLSPFSFSGSRLSSQEMVCYQIEIIHLTIPHIHLKSGGNIATYPYLYVKFENSYGARSGINDIIYSNNPNSRGKLFRISIDDSNPTTSFFNLEGKGMVQTIKFKPNDSLSFGVYLPDGTPIDFVIDDTISPSYPDPRLQISAMFSIQRL